MGNHMTNNLLHIPKTTEALLNERTCRVSSHEVENWFNQVHCGDCVELMNKMPADCVDLVVTSPPYNLRNSTGNVRD